MGHRCTQMKRKFSALHRCRICGSFLFSRRPQRLGVHSTEANELIRFPLDLHVQHLYGFELKLAPAHRCKTRFLRNLQCGAGAIVFPNPYWPPRLRGASARRVNHVECVYQSAFAGSHLQSSALAGVALATCVAASATAGAAWADALAGLRWASSSLSSDQSRPRVTKSR
jgi:hypothetical protein